MFPFLAPVVMAAILVPLMSMASSSLHVVDRGSQHCSTFVKEAKSTVEVSSCTASFRLGDMAWWFLRQEGIDVDIKNELGDEGDGYERQSQVFRK